jgi:hypothetical protein
VSLLSFDAMHADDVPVAHTPDGGYGETMPPPILGCTDHPLADGAPDMRGTWKIVEIAWREGIPEQPRMYDHVERIEQCGDRVIVTASGVIHDMRADGTEANGVHDVAAADMKTAITVVCTFEDGVHVLRPVGLPVEVTRRLDGDRLVWSYGPMFEARLERIA